jgi:molybdopterin-containing oxidoreductase family iron-sulfur binding subunit
MQEMPDPMTKLVWDNAALLSPATAKKLNVADGNLLNLSVGGSTLEIAAMIQPGHADDSITIPCGYGRKEVGRVGKGTGFNGYAVRVAGALGFGAVSVSNTGKEYKLVTTQEFHSMEEPKLSAIQPAHRPIVREADVEEYRKEPEFAKEMVEAPDDSIYGWWDYSKGNQWGMAVDLNACIGCNACLIACQSENNIPVVGKTQVSNGREMHWIRLDRYYTGDAEDPQAVMQPLPCQQCENAPCESVCPVAATTHSPEGLNDMAYNRCVGTRYCANNCPYKVRYFNWYKYNEQAWPEPLHLQLNPDVTVRARGVMEKCTFCIQRIRDTQNHARLEDRPIRDGEFTTACAQACPSDAIVFGNVKDGTGRVARIKQDPRGYHVLEDLNVRPAVTYLAKVLLPAEA